MARAAVAGWTVRTTPTCACGCRGELPRQKYYGRLRLIYGEYPRFLVGHAARSPEVKALITGRPDIISKWLSSNQGKFLCQCGCGTPIKLQAEYHHKGVPRYSHGHHPNSHSTRRGDFKKDCSVRKFRVAERVEILARSSFCCAECGWGGVKLVQHLEVDHIVPIAQGGMTVVDNGQALCQVCHLAKTNIDNKIRVSHASYGGRGFRK